MSRLLISMACLWLLAAAWVAAAVPAVQTLHVAYAVQAPVLDGKLDDPCWKQLPVYSTFYKFGTVDAQPTTLRTGMQFGYDAAGVYLGVSLWMDDVTQLRATVTQRDDGNIWKDDCAEIYFDPSATAIGFRKFTVNALGTKTDLYRMDPANIDESWSPDGWQAAVGKDDKGWYIEAFFPWSDLGRQAKDGDLWRFCLCRFSWLPKPVLATSSVGGSYTAPDHYGWLLFLKDRDAQLDGLAAQLAQRIPGDWLVPIQEKAVIKSAGRVLVVTMTEILSEIHAGALAELQACREIAGTGAEAVKTGDGIAAQLAATPVTTTDTVVFQQSISTFGKLSQQMEDWKYTILLKQLTAPKQ